MPFHFQAVTTGRSINTLAGGTTKSRELFLLHDGNRQTKKQSNWSLNFLKLSSGSLKEGYEIISVSLFYLRQELKEGDKFKIATGQNISERKEWLSSISHYKNPFRLSKSFFYHFKLLKNELNGNPINILKRPFDASDPINKSTPDSIAPTLFKSLYLRNLMPKLDPFLKSRKVTSVSSPQLFCLKESLIVHMQFIDSMSITFRYNFSGHINLLLICRLPIQWLFSMYYLVQSDSAFTDSSSQRHLFLIWIDSRTYSALQINGIFLLYH